MKTSRLKTLLIVAVFVAVGGCFLVAYLRRPQPSFQETVAFVRSVHAFVETRKQHGTSLPSSVQLRELVDAGCIGPDMARRFDGSEVTFPRVPSESQPLGLAPQQVLVNLRLPDGREIVMTADGSIHQLAKPAL